MKRLGEVALGMVTGIGGFLEVGSIATSAQAGADFGYRLLWAVALGTLAPVPYSVLCYAAGLYRIPYMLFSAFTLLRVPRLLFFYLIIRTGWGLAHPL
ncbi:MAG: hypothetical protein JO306_03190 [Gemmatimonadetes bacterium]|nr:hypothetical protein [Gemmatimonadota bacterium]